MGNTISAVVINTDGSYNTKDIDASATDLDALNTFQGIVGGWIEAVTPQGRHDVTFYINEEGKLDGLPLNPLANALFQRLGGRLLPSDFGLVGNVAVVGGPDDIGYDQSVPNDIMGLLDELSGMPAVLRQRPPTA